MKKGKEQIAPDGTKAGDRIPNSRFVRGFCPECGEPVRTTTKELLSCFCERCCPPMGIKYTVQELMDENLFVHPFDDIGYSYEVSRSRYKKRKFKRKRK